MKLLRYLATSLLCLPVLAVYLVLFVAVWVGCALGWLVRHVHAPK